MQPPQQYEHFQTHLEHVYQHNVSATQNMSSVHEVEECKEESCRSKNWQKHQPPLSGRRTETLYTGDWYLITRRSVVGLLRLLTILNCGRLRCILQRNLVPVVVSLESTDQLLH